MGLHRTHQGRLSWLGVSWLIRCNLGRTFQSTGAGIPVDCALYEDLCFVSTPIIKGRCCSCCHRFSPELG